MQTLVLGLVLMIDPPPPVPDPDPEPRRGRVALSLGIVAMVASAPTVAAGAAFTLNPGKPAEPMPGERGPVPIGPILLGAGIGCAALGSVGLIVGSRLNGKWKAWAARHPERTSRLRLAPAPWAGREGFGFTLVGRF